MKRSEKVNVQIVIEERKDQLEDLGSRSVPVATLLNLDPGEKVPDPADWSSAAEAFESYVADLLHAYDLELAMYVEYPNPAYDTFPGTVALLPEHEPSPKKVFEVRFRLDPGPARF